MAAIENNSSGRKYLPRAPRVDMTPMVDLGFLLITFFVFNTQVTKDMAVTYNTPIPDMNNPMLVKCTKTITLLPGVDGKVKWIDCVDGVEQPAAEVSLYAGRELRSRLMAKRDQMNRFFGDPHELFVIIRPDSSCSYSTFIDVVDEMMIADVTRYAVTDL
jgi:biopolymer transport protein ExbD